MRNHTRYLLIVAIILILSILLLPGFSATRKGIKPMEIGGSSSNYEPVRGGRFLIASLLMIDDPFADLVVTKTANSEQVMPGSNLTYTIEVNNGGPDAAANATLSDMLPQGMTFVSLSAPAGWLCTTPNVGDGGTVTCTNPTLAAASHDVFTLVVKVPSEVVPGTFFTNIAKVSTATPDPNEENNSSTAATMVATTGADLVVTKTANSEQVMPGSNLTYTIEVNNGGPDAAANATLSDTLPGNTTFVSLSAPAGWSCSTPAVGAGGTVSCTKASLARGDSSLFSLVVNVPSGTAGGTTYTNTATVSTTTTDFNTENNSSTVTTEVSSADLSVTKMDTPDPVLSGSNLTYTITVNNAGPGNAVSPLMSDMLPAATTFVSLSSPGNWSCTTPAEGAGGGVSCYAPFFATGSAVFTLVVKVNSSVPGGTVLSNTATVSSSSPDPTTGNESYTVTTNVLSPATLSGTKTVSGQFNPGGSVTYNVVINNTGPGTQGNNSGDEFIDVLPNGLTLVSATASSGTATATIGTNTVNWNGSLPSGNSVAITIQATIKSGTAGTTISNQGTINYDADGNGTNESSALTDDPGVAGSSNPTSFVVQNAPTISAVAVTRTAGTPSSNSTIANVNDVEDAENTLNVMVNNSSSAIASGVTISHIIVSAAGVVTADVVAACGATTATFTLKVTDSGGATNTATLTVTVNNNPAPTLTYSNQQTVTFGGSLTINPATGPSDNGSISTIAVQSQGTYTGSLSVNNSTGAVSISNAAPAGTHTITIRATDNCGATTDASFNLVVSAQPTFSISNVSVTEGNSGTTEAVFTVTLSASSGLTTKVDYQTADATATSGSDYQPTSGTLTFNPGELTKTIIVQVKGDTTNEPAETFLVNLTNPQNATLTVAQGTGTILNDDAPVIQLSGPGYSVSEATGHATITVTRTGDTSQPASVDYATSDLSGLANCNVTTGNASQRCDYTAMAGTLNFSAGQTSATFDVPIINDVYVEGPETLTLSLSNAVGGILGSQSTSTLTITDNDFAPGAANPIDDPAFFVREQYLDFLNREPEPSGLQGWLSILNNCPAADKRCDRVGVSSGFFRSPEFFNRTYFIYRFYKTALGRKPTYDEYQQDIRRVTGFLTDAELETRKQMFVSEFVQRQEFKNRYDSRTDGSDYVNAIVATAGVTPSNSTNVANRQGAHTITRGQALRELVESPEISAAYFNEAFVVVGYFAYLRRDPDALYLVWIGKLNNPPAGQTFEDTYREMIRGFIESTEYRARFGQ